MKTEEMREEEELLIEICRKHGVEPDYLAQLFSVEKEYADRNLSKRRGIFERLSNLISAWAEEEEKRRAIL